MSKIDYIAIELNKPGQTYTVGEEVAGKLVMKVKERLKVNAIKLRGLGQSVVRW